MLRKAKKIMAKKATQETTTTETTTSLFVMACSTTDEAHAAYTEATAAIAATEITYAPENSDSPYARSYHTGDATEAISKFVGAKHKDLGITDEVAEKVVALHMQTIPAALQSVVADENYRRFSEKYAAKKEGEMIDEKTTLRGKHAGATSVATAHFAEENNACNLEHGVVVKSDALSSWQVNVHTKMQALVTDLLSKK